MSSKYKVLRHQVEFSGATISKLFLMQISNTRKAVG